MTSHIQRHKDLLRNEVRLEHIQAEYEFRRKAMEHFERTEGSHQHQEYQNLRANIAPRTYEEKLQYLDDRSCQDAGSWLIKHTDFRNWVNQSNTSHQVLWLDGIPGSGTSANSGLDIFALTHLVGKTYLARTVVHETRKREHSLFAFLSYAYSENTSALSILHSLVFQLSADDSILQAIVCQSSGEKFRHSTEVVKSIFKTLLLNSGTVYITIDGLDEIDGASRCQILTILLQLVSEVGDLRLLISCRAEPDIASILKLKCLIVRIHELNIGGIQSFVTQRTELWYTQREFYPEVEDEMKSLLAPLAHKAKGSTALPQVWIVN